MKFWIQTLIALFLTATVLSGCNKADEAAPAADGAVSTTEPAAPADAATVAPAEEPATKELGGWSPPAEDATPPAEETTPPAEEPTTTE